MDDFLFPQSDEDILAEVLNETYPHEQMDAETEKMIKNFNHKVF